MGIRGMLGGLLAGVGNGGGRVGLLLSGGVDSVVLGVVLGDLGIDFVAYTFGLEGYGSADVGAAREVCSRLGWRYEEHIIGRASWGSGVLASDFLRLIGDYGCIKKTQVECTWPFLHLYGEMAGGGVTDVVSGVAADGHYGLSRSALISGIRDDRVKFDAFRAAYFAKENPAGVLQQRQLAAEWGMRFWAPYLASEYFDFMMGFGWSEINRPREKEIVLREFAEVTPRLHKNLQLVSGVSAVFAKLLEDDEINFNGRSRLMDVVADHVRLLVSERREFELRSRQLGLFG